MGTPADNRFYREKFVMKRSEAEEMIDAFVVAYDRAADPLRPTWCFDEDNKKLSAERRKLVDALCKSELITSR